MPQIGQSILDATFYLYASKEDADHGRNMGGTGFLIADVRKNEFNRHPLIYAVTNWHVAIRDGFSVIRLNCKDGTTDCIVSDPSDWEFLPGGPDVAAIRIEPDGLKHQFSSIPVKEFVRKNRFAHDPDGVSTGEDVFMVGRFMDHDGGEVNQPAVRFGNISVMPTSVYVPDLGRAEELYCVDLHSRSGYSGSPVFAYRTLGSDLSGRDLRILYDDIVNMAKSGNRPNFSPYVGLLGIHCGQFPEDYVAGTKDKEGRMQPLSNQYIIGMSGMGLVSPGWTIEALLDRPRFRANRMR